MSTQLHTNNIINNALLMFFCLPQKKRNREQQQQQQRRKTKQITYTHVLYASFARSFVAHFLWPEYNYWLLIPLVYVCMYIHTHAQACIGMCVCP